MKLHLGCGKNKLPGWINIDRQGVDKLYNGCPAGYYKYDILNKFPFDDGAVDFIFWEHVVEHFDIPDLYKIVREMYRLLRAGGIVRTACPNMEFLFNVSLNEGTRNRLAAKWGFIDPTTAHSFIKDCWCYPQHQFTHTYNTLWKVFCDCGFTTYFPQPNKKSTIQELCNLESRESEDNSLIMECIK